MIKFPAIDIKDGKCVRLLQGKKEQVTIYSDNPVDVAKHWEKQGAQYLHIVDLDGAFSGQAQNNTVITNIVHAVNIPVQVGGGIRTAQRVKDLLNTGVSRCIVGTMPFNDLETFKMLLATYGDKIVVSLDCLNNQVMIKGWVENSGQDVENTVKTLINQGVKTLVYTDISKDGMMMGTNLNMLETLNGIGDIDIIASGGISSLADITHLEKIGVYGAIIGKALYEGTITSLT